MQNSDLELIKMDTFERLKNSAGGVYPFHDYLMLKFLVGLKKPHKILELGTALGLTALAMASGFEEAEITSVDRSNINTKIAENNAKKYQLSSRISFLNQEFLDYLAKIERETYEMVFFDGFAPGLTVFLEMERVLKPSGLIVCANLDLGGDTKKIRLRMEDDSLYKSYFEQNGSIYGVKV
jgi:predicted O-methyltransferase YrrM